MLSVYSIRGRILTLYYFLFSRNRVYRKRHRKIAKKMFDSVISAAPAGAVAFDCGANVGKITTVFLENGFRVHAFEPDPVASKVLLEKFGTDSRLTFSSAAVGVSNSKEKLFRRDDFADSPEKRTTSSTLFERERSDQENFVEVEVIDLIEYIKNISERISILKMDIEGAEVDLLEKLIDSGVYKKIDFILVETHERISFDFALRTARLRARIRTNGLVNFNLDHI